jgi:hypothetical protein
MFGFSNMPSDSSGRLSTPRAHNPTIRHGNGTNNYNSTALTVYMSTETFLLRFSTHPGLNFDPLVVAHADHIRSNPAYYWDYENDVSDEYFDLLNIWEDDNPIEYYDGDDFFVEDTDSLPELEIIQYEADTLVEEYESSHTLTIAETTVTFGLVDSYREFFRKPVLRLLYEWHTEPLVGIAEGCFRFFKPREQIDRPYT